MNKKANEYFLALYEIQYNAIRDNVTPTSEFGFYRWVPSFYIAKEMGIKTSKARYEFDKLANEGLIDRKKQIGGSILYSLKGIEDCVIKGDYFIEAETR